MELSERYIDLNIYSSYSLQDIKETNGWFGGYDFKYTLKTYIFNIFVL